MYRLVTAIHRTVGLLYSWPCLLTGLILTCVCVSTRHRRALQREKDERGDYRTAVGRHMVTGTLYKYTPGGAMMGSSSNKT